MNELIEKIIINENINNQIYYLNNDIKTTNKFIKELIFFLIQYTEKKDIKENNKIIDSFLNECIELNTYIELFENNLKESLINLMNDIINNYKKEFLNNKDILENTFNYSLNTLDLNLYLNYCYSIIPLDYNELNNNIFKKLYESNKSIKDNLYNLSNLKEYKEYYFTKKELIRHIDLLII